MEWEGIAKNILKSELAKRGLSYEKLSEKLASVGVIETPNALNTKINRGAFQFVFFLQCARAIGIKSVLLEESYFDT